MAIPEQPQGTQPMSSAKKLANNYLGKVATHSPPLGHIPSYQQWLEDELIAARELLEKLGAGKVVSHEVTFVVQPGPATRMGSISNLIARQQAFGGMLLKHLPGFTRKEADGWEVHDVVLYDDLEFEPDEEHRGQEDAPRKYVRLTICDGSKEIPETSETGLSLSALCKEVPALLGRAYGEGTRVIRVESKVHRHMATVRHL